MTYALLVPEAIVVAGAVFVLLLARLDVQRYRRARGYLPGIAAGLLLVALAIELAVGATLGTYFDGALVEDRFALFVKAAALLATATAIGVADWSAEDSLSVSLAMPMLATFGVMVVASAGDFVVVWAGLEAAGVAGVAMLAFRRPELGSRLLIAGAGASALMLTGLGYLYAGLGTAQLVTVRAAVSSAVVSLPLAVPVLLILGALVFRASFAPLQLGTAPAAQATSPLSTGLVAGLVAAAALVAAAKIAAAINPVIAALAPFLELMAAVAMVGGGAGAVAARSPRARIAFMATGQSGWILAGLSTHYRGGMGAAVLMLGAFVVAATAAPAAAGATAASDVALSGLGTLRPHRAAAIALSMLSLAGAPPLAGFFGQFAVGAALAQAGRLELLALGLVGSTMCLVAAVRTIRLLYLQPPPEEGQRAGLALPPWTRFSAGAAVVLCLAIGGFALLANPILSLADQGAEALGMR